MNAAIGRSTPNPEPNGGGMNAAIERSALIRSRTEAG